MNISHILDRARALIVIAGMAAVACLGAGQAAYAADFKMDPKMQAQGMADAPAIIASAGITCDPANAYMRGDTTVTDNGQQLKGKLYEIACKAGPGFMVTKTPDGAAHQPFTCMVAAKIQKTKSDSIVCVLPENNPPYKWLQPIAEKYIPGCQVSDARLLGSTTSGSLIDRYEVACGANGGGIIDYPQFKSTAQVAYHNCLMVDGTPSACTLTTKAQISAQMAPLAAKADPKCQVSGARFVGVAKESQATYYEFGCSNQVGFMVQVNPDGSFSREVPCSAAAGLGGCTLTAGTAVAATANATYSAELKAAGKPCTVSEYNVVGSQEATHRDYVEFKCPEQPWGLIGFVPQPGAQADVNVTDCFMDQVRHKSCTLTTAAQLQAQVDKLIKIAEPNKGCDVKQVRYIGEAESPEGALIVEVACSNKRGYIGIINPERTKIEADPCRLAAAHHDAQKCTIPENGTYAE
jgi:hypothetical protein